MKMKEDYLKAFPITSVCREDLKRYFTEEEIDRLDDADMRYLARKMADAYCEQGFWIDLEILGRYLINEK
jgi:hypothetical protein